MYHYLDEENPIDSQEAEIERKLTDSELLVLRYIGAGRPIEQRSVVGDLEHEFQAENKNEGLEYLHSEIRIIIKDLVQLELIKEKKPDGHNKYRNAKLAITENGTLTLENNGVVMRVATIKSSPIEERRYAILQILEKSGDLSTTDIFMQSQELNVIMTKSQLSALLRSLLGKDIITSSGSGKSRRYNGSQKITKALEDTRKIVEKTTQM